MCCAQTFASQERQSSHQELQACAARMLDHCQRFLDGRLPRLRGTEWVEQMRLKNAAILAVSSSVAEQPATMTMIQEPEQTGADAASGGGEQQPLADSAAARRQQVRAAQAAALEHMRAQQAVFLESALLKPALHADPSHNASGTANAPLINR